MCHIFFTLIILSDDGSEKLKKYCPVGNNKKYFTLKLHSQVPFKIKYLLLRTATCR
jgi:hypothetical protein